MITSVSLAILYTLPQYVPIDRFWFCFYILFISDMRNAMHSHIYLVCLSISCPYKKIRKYVRKLLHGIFHL